MLIIFKKGNLENIWKITQKKANLGSFLLAEIKMMSIFAIHIL